METYSQIDWESFAKDNDIFSIVSDNINQIFFKKENNNNECFKKYNDYKLFIETSIVNQYPTIIRNFVFNKDTLQLVKFQIFQNEYFFK